MRTRTILATLVALCCTLIAVSSVAQDSPGAPTITSVTGDLTSLTVVWSAPTEDGGSTITAYDLRYIRSDAAANATDSDWTVIDDAWTSGSLTYTLTSLRRDTSYDIALRAENTDGAGEWSDTTTTSTSDHGNSTSDATTLALGSSIEGSIDPATDADLFKIVVSGRKDLWIYASGPLDTTGYLVNSSGSLLAKNQNSNHVEFPRAFSIRHQVNTGTYYVKVESHGRLVTGTYILHTQAATDPGYTGPSATRIALNSMTPGRLYFPGGDNGAIDMFRFVLEESTDIWAHSVGAVDTVGFLHNGRVIATNDDTPWPYYPLSFLLNARLAPGTYYLQVKGYHRRDTGAYTLELRESTTPGGSQSNATPISLDLPQTGYLSSTADVDHFKLSITDDTYVTIQTLAFGSRLPVTISGTGITSLANAYSKPHSTWVSRNQAKIGYWTWGKLAAGEYQFAVAPAGSDTGWYMFFISTDRSSEVLDSCEAITTSFDDPLYGCQWHLNNTGQFPDGAMQDLGVEEVWDTSDPTTMGEGINIAVVDDGIDADHADLSANVNTSRNYNYNTATSDVSHPHETHGTGVAGIIASRDNTIGVIGVAPRATIYNYNLIGHGVATSANDADAMTRNMADTAVYNNSWGFSPLGLGNPAFAQSSWERAVVNGVTNGYVVNGHPKGVSYIFSAGNGHAFGGLSNLDGHKNHYAVTAVCAVNYNDKRSSYSQRGANLWVCGLSNDRGAIHDLPAITTLRNNDRYRDDFSGASAATPMVSGVVALIRAANQELTWRDVKVILAESARKNDPDDPGWRTGAERYGSDGDYEFNYQYGFGVVNAKAAVDLAKSWTNLPPMRTRKAVSTDAAQSIPAASYSLVPGATIESTLIMDDYVDFIEFVQINVDFKQTFFRNIDIELIAPSGESAMLSPAASIEFASAFDGNFRFGSALHLGEDAAGVWKLRMTNRLGQKAGTLRGWSVTVYGHGFTPGLLKVSAATPGVDSLDVFWTSPVLVDRETLSAVASYDLRYIRADATDQSDSRWTTVNSLSASGTLQHKLDNLDALTEYQIQVRAHNDAGPGPWSELFAATTFDNPPSVPRNISVDSRDVALAVSWQEPGSSGGRASSYDVRHIESDAIDKADPNSWTDHLGAWADGDGDLLYRIPNLTNGEQYDVQVRGANDGGTGDWSATRTATPELRNSQPRFPSSGSSARYVDENSPAGTEIGNPVAANDDETDPLTYSLSSGSEFFEIVAMSGQLLTKSALDRESRSSYTVTVQVSDLKNVAFEADTVIDDTVTVTVEVNNVDEPAMISGRNLPMVMENSNPRIDRYTASDPDGEPVSEWRLEGADRDKFQIVNGDLSFIEPPNFEARADSDGNNEYEVTIVARAGALDGRYDVTVTVENVNEAPVAADDTASTDEDTSLTVNVLPLASDPDGDPLTLSLGAGPGHGTATVDAANYEITYTPSVNYHGPDRFTYIVSDDRLTDRGEITLSINPVNDSPVFRSSTAEFEVAIDAEAGDFVGRLTATDNDGDTPIYTLSYSPEFEIHERSGAITVRQDATIDPSVDSYYVSVTADDQQGQYNSTASADVTIKVVEQVTPLTSSGSTGSGGGGGGGGGGGPPPVPVPSDVEFDWNVTRDIESLHRDNDLSTGLWSNGEVLWIVENSASGADRLFAYNLNTGERLEEHEFELERRNRFSHGIWSNGELVWIADSGQDKLFAYNLATGERNEGRDLELDERNRDPREIWSNGELILVLDSVKKALFVYNLESGQLLAEYPLDNLNQSPRGIWSDGFTIWVSDDGANRIFAYRMEGEMLNRYEDQEFTFRSLLKAGNGEARGIWSDGDVIFVTDEQDDQIYTYNMPDAIDTRLASLTLSDVDFGEFTSSWTKYIALVDADLTQTTVDSAAAQTKATVEISPADADNDPDNGYQVSLEAETTITIEVTSLDGSRTTTYQVQVNKSPCLEGLSVERLSEVSFFGGSVSELEACARSLDVSAIHHNRNGVWTALFLLPDLPQFLSQPFHTRFPEGLPPSELLIATRQLPAVSIAGSASTN